MTTFFLFFRHNIFTGERFQSKAVLQEQIQTIIVPGLHEPQFAFYLGSKPSCSLVNALLVLTSPLHAVVPVRTVRRCRRGYVVYDSPRRGVSRTR